VRLRSKSCKPNVKGRTAARFRNRQAPRTLSWLGAPHIAGFGLIGHHDKQSSQYPQGDVVVVLPETLIHVASVLFPNSHEKMHFLRGEYSG
jgi:hypothetical protein